MNGYALGLRLHGKSARTGDSFVGSVRIDPRSTIESGEVRAELVRQELAGTDPAETVVSRSVLARNERFAAAVSRELSFHLQVPQDERSPTLTTEHSSVTWKVRAVFAETPRSSTTIESLVWVGTR